MERGGWLAFDPELRLVAYDDEGADYLVTPLNRVLGTALEEVISDAAPEDLARTVRDHVRAGGQGREWVDQVRGVSVRIVTGGQGTVDVHFSRHGSASEQLTESADVHDQAVASFRDLVLARSIRELAAIVSRFATENGLSGSLALKLSHTSELAPVATWGDWPADPISGDGCMALRAGMTRESSGHEALRCEAAPPGVPHVCVPLAVNGELLGVLTLAGKTNLRPLTEELAVAIRARLLEFR